MKTMKAILSATVLAAVIGAINLQAVTTPHFAGAPNASAPAGAPRNLVSNVNALGAAAKSKSQRASVATTATDPTLVACAKRGKASCAKSGTIAPCCQGMVACK